jgi:glutathionylspermidine amidase/synthetase
MVANMKTAQAAPPAKFGTILGYASGQVAVYSSDYDSVDDESIPDRHAYLHYLDGVFMGYKWQCVELARRWLYINEGYIFDDVPMAFDIFNLRQARQISSGEKLPLHAFRNGSKRPPQRGSLLIWSEGGEFEVTGHVAIVTEATEHYVRLVEQNVDNHIWPEGQDYSRQIKARVTAEGHYWIQCSFGDGKILGWVIQTEDNRHAEPAPRTDMQLFRLLSREINQSAQIDTSKQQNDSWLNIANEDEAAYVAMMGGHKLASRAKDQYRYYVMSKTAQQEIRHASNELHRLFMFATDYVLQDDARLASFNIPPIVWPKIRQSWGNRRTQMITGRFDFSVSERGIKVYEYNADSASCYMECGKVQGKWAEHFGCSEGSDPGAQLFARLVEAWQQSDVNDVLHIMMDSDQEESYHALFMQSALDQANINSKIITGLEGVRWGNNGQIVDSDDMPIRWVWKTWAWETALDQIRRDCEEVSAQGGQSMPRLADVLLHPEVMVYEPLWTLIPSNKAILPVMWQLFPEHRHLLDTRYTLSEELKNQGYAVKPIAGRCGWNISMVDKHQNTIEETAGRFDQQDQIYQQLWRLPKIDEYHVQLSSFSVAGKYAGSCLRVDESALITRDSDILPLRVIDDSDFLKK